MKLYIFLFCLILTVAGLKIAYGEHYIHISGRVESEALRKKNKLFWVKTVKNGAYPYWISFTETYTCNLDESGAFNLQIPATDSLIYVVMQLKSEAGNQRELNPASAIEQAFLLQSGDDISIIITDDQTQFKGKGSEKLTCQQAIHTLNIYPQGVKDALADRIENNEYGMYCQGVVNAVEKNLEMKLAILEMFKHNLRRDIYELIYLDCVGAQYGGMLKSMYTFRKAKGHNIKILRQVMNGWRSKIDMDTARLATRSPYYLNYLYEKNRFYMVFNTMGDSLNLHFRFADFVKRINKNYNGGLRDALQTYALINLAKEKPDAMLQLEPILASIKDGLMHGILQEWKSSNAEKQAAYPFRLMGIDGNEHSLKDFKGKVLIIDFWFNGCTGCRYMTPALKHIVDYYRCRKDVAFLSISVDRKKEGWLRGVKTGDYTLPEQMELWIGEKDRTEHPLLKHYNIRGYPHLLLIDQQGRTVSSNPPDARVDNGQGIIAIVNRLFNR